MQAVREEFEACVWDGAWTRRALWRRWDDRAGNVVEMDILRLLLGEGARYGAKWCRVWSRLAVFTVVHSLRRAHISQRSPV
jgi:hypothetical protein